MFLAEGTRENGANLLTGGLVELRPRRTGALEPNAIAAQLAPTIEGLSQMPALRCRSRSRRER